MNKKSTLYNHIALFFIVFLTGASVMVIELLGTRMIAPFYGASLYVWSSLISVTMIALAIGYFVGGRWADRAKRTGLSLIIALAALFTLLIPLMTRTVLLATDPLGLRTGAFVSALVLFSPSLTLLGMVGPFAIKLSTSQLEGVGNSAGSIYAVSTLGSVIGTLVLGFYLFPMIGSRQILVGLGLLLGRNLAAELTKGNTAVGIVAAGYDVAVALIVSQSLAGSTQNELVPNLAFCALGFAALLALVAVLRALTPWDDAAQLRSANSAAALAHAGMTLAVGLLVSHATSGAFDGWTASLRAFGEVVAFALLLVPIRIGIVQGILLGGGLRWRGGPLDQLVGEQRHTGVAALEAAALVGGALALRAVVG